MSPYVNACCCPLAGSHWSESRAHLLTRMISCCRRAQLIQNCCSTAASRRHLCLLGGRCCSSIHLSHLQEWPDYGEHMQVLNCQPRLRDCKAATCFAKVGALALRATCCASPLPCAGIAAWSSIPTEGVICSAPEGPADALCFLLRALFFSVSGPGAMSVCALSCDLRSLSDTTAYHYSQPSSPQGNASYLAWDCGIGRVSPLPKAEVSLRPLRKYKSGLSASRPHGRRSTVTRTGGEASQPRQDLLASCEHQGATLQWSQVNSAHAPALLWRFEYCTQVQCSGSAW